MFLPPYSLDEITPDPIHVSGDVFQAIAAWPFPEEPFFHRQVGRVIRESIPLYAEREDWVGAWAYRETANPGQIVGFGSIRLADLYADIADSPTHLYIPVLTGNPQVSRGGVGKAIMNHLVSEAIGRVD